jgi:hypothetical protein
LLHGLNERDSKGLGTWGSEKNEYSNLFLKLYGKLQLGRPW